MSMTELKTGKIPGQIRFSLDPPRQIPKRVNNSLAVCQGIPGHLATSYVCKIIIRLFNWTLLLKY